MNIIKGVLPIVIIILFQLINLVVTLMFNECKVILITKTEQLTIKLEPIRPPLLTKMYELNSVRWHLQCIKTKATYLFLLPIHLISHVLDFRRRLLDTLHILNIEF